MAEQTVLHYRLGRSVVRVAGTLTRVEDSVTGDSHSASTAAVTVEAEADSEVDLQLKTTEELFRDRDFELKFADDGRLLSASSTETGVGATVVEAGVRIATSAVALVARLAPAAVGEAAPEAEEGAAQEASADPEAAYAESDPTSAGHRSELRTALSALTTALAQAGEHVAAATTAADEKALIAHFRAIQVALGAIRGEAELVEARYDAWRATTKTATTTELAFTLVTDELLEADDVDELTLATADLSARLKPVANGLNLIVVLTADPDRPPAGRAWNADEPVEGIYMRLPRPIVFSVYETTDDVGKPSRKYRRTSRRVVSIVDEHSELDFLGFDTHFFGKHVAGVELSASGAASKITSSATAPAGEAARALSAGVGQAQETLDQAVKMSDAMSKLRSAADTDRLAALKRRKDELETRIAEKGVLATQGDIEKLAEVKAETDLVEARKQLATDQSPTPAPDELTQLKNELAKAKAELELRRVQAQLDEAAR